MQALADSGKTRTAAIRCLMSRRLAGLLARQRFPRYRAAFGYGSAVIPQRSTAAPALVDAVLCVDDARAWHAANVLRNPAHYSWLKTLGPAAIATAQKPLPSLRLLVSSENYKVPCLRRTLRGFQFVKIKTIPAASAASQR